MAEPFKRSPYVQNTTEESIWYVQLLTHLASYVSLFGAILAEWLVKYRIVSSNISKDDPRNKGFASLNDRFEGYYTNYPYRLASDVMNRPICGVPGAIVDVSNRQTSDEGWAYTQDGSKRTIVNLGSYNYLGFSHNDGPCAQRAADYIDKYGLHMGGTRHEGGNHVTQKHLEECIANYLKVESAIAFPMGFSTNAMNIPALVDKGSLILSDKFNHASLVLGCRLSGATIKVFKHNNPQDCERLLRNALCELSPKTGKAYNKVLIVLEGIYSMEGTIIHLPAFIEIKKKYKSYLFLDEAHSIGALGPTGRGVVEYWGCDPKDVDVMMGTLTKSFAAAGGYMGGSKAVIDHIRAQSHGSCYGAPISPPLVAQVAESMKIMTGEDGTDIGNQKAVRLLKNSRYFRRRLIELGFMVYGHEDSPVVPLMTFWITKVVYISRRMFDYNIGVVAVGYPATSLSTARVRFCLSADHTKEQLDYVLKMMDVVGDETGSKYMKAIKPNPAYSSDEEKAR
ncbi:hypothetical protein WR25_21775 [Diploscapter pachys]|uniref:Aminotransferase class I/classII large domain-containing protein n=1 Tax=Diploscapter pachys TaxID=2018661 RepID=A0A2A2LFB3_9BILA|nr:hypothetical protein WR25_21775 [Diploscapter pachys]